MTPVPQGGGRPSRAPEILALLRKRGAAGDITSSIADACDMRIQYVNRYIKQLIESGHVRWTSETGFKAAFRCRYYLNEFAPEGASSTNPGDAMAKVRERFKVKRMVSGNAPVHTLRLDPKQKADDSRAKVTVCPSGLDHRHTFTGTPGRHVDSSQCRPWAAAAVGAV